MRVFAEMGRCMDISSIYYGEYGHGPIISLSFPVSPYRSTLGLTGTVGVSLCTFLLIMGTGHKWVPCFCSGRRMQISEGICEGYIQHDLIWWIPCL